MSADGQQPRQNRQLIDDPRGQTGVARMTSRGTKYWNSGAIPLIAPEILGNIITEVADLAVVVNDDGTVLSVLVNPNYQAFSKLEQLEGKDLRSSLTVESVPKFDERLAAFLDRTREVKQIELNHKDPDLGGEFPMRYSFHRIGPDGAILMLGRDLRPVAEMQQQLIRAQLALERDFEAQRDFDTRFRVLMDATGDAVIFVSVQTGKITEANQKAAELLGVEKSALPGHKIADLLGSRRRGALIDVLSSQAISDRGTPVSAELQATGAQLTISSTLFRAAGERVLLCRISATDPANNNRDSLAENLRGLYQSGPDGIVFTTDDGRVLAANDSFLNLIGVGHDVNVRGQHVSEYFLRGSVDFKVMSENAVRLGRMKSYATKIAGEYGSPRSVEVSVTTISAGKSTVLSFVMRDANRIDTGRSAVSQVRDDSMQSVVELVGSATLKEIVSETTNVVEKMCIETAVQLTMNNRVAAAEMLGLSRQSLYVKLRKFGLLSRDVDEQD